MLHRIEFHEFFHLLTQKKMNKKKDQNHFLSMDVIALQPKSFLGLSGRFSLRKCLKIQNFNWFKTIQK